MGKYFRVTTDADEPAAEIIFEVAVDTFSGAAFFVARGLGRVEAACIFGGAVVEIDEGNMSFFCNSISNNLRIIRGIHQLIKNAVCFLFRQFRKRERYLAIMHRSRCQDGTDRDITISRIYM